MIKHMPQFELRNSETVVQFAKDAVVRMNEQEDATAPVDFDYYIREVEKLCLGLS